MLGVLSGLSAPRDGGMYPAAYYPCRYIGEACGGRRQVGAKGLVGGGAWGGGVVALRRFFGKLNAALADLDLHGGIDGVAYQSSLIRCERGLCGGLR